jgi:hypothetical protein
LGGGLAQTGESCIGRRIKKFARILRNPGLDRFVAAERGGEAQWEGKYRNVRVTRRATGADLRRFPHPENLKRQIDVNP